MRVVLPAPPGPVMPITWGSWTDRLRADDLAVGLGDSIARVSWRRQFMVFVTLGNTRLGAVGMKFFPIGFLDEIDDFFKRRSGKEDSGHALPFHDCGVGGGNRAAPTCEYTNSFAAPIAQPSKKQRTEFDVAAVVAGDADGPHVFLYCGPGNIISRAMITQINDLNPVPNEFEVDRTDGAVVAVTDWDGSQQPNWHGRHYAHDTPSREGEAPAEPRIVNRSGSPD